MQRRAITAAIVLSLLTFAGFLAAQGSSQEPQEQNPIRAELDPVADLESRMRARFKGSVLFDVIEITVKITLCSGKVVEATYYRQPSETMTAFLDRIEAHGAKVIRQGGI